jgi:hypothetical protein
MKKGVFQPTHLNCDSISHFRNLHGCRDGIFNERDLKITPYDALQSII